MAEANDTVHGSEQSIVSALADVHTGMDVSAALTHQDVASLNELTIGALGAQALGVGITAVLGGAAALRVGEEL